MTFPQAKELGGAVRKGETGTIVVYASSFIRDGTTETGAVGARLAGGNVSFYIGYSDVLGGTVEKTTQACSLSAPPHIGECGKRQVGVDLYGISPCRCGRYRDRSVGWGGDGNPSPETRIRSDDAADGAISANCRHGRPDIQRLAATPAG